MSGGRWVGRWARALLFTTGALLSAWAVYGGIGLLGRVLGDWKGFKVGALAILSWALVWHATRITVFPGSLDRTQARRELASRGMLGPFYFGAILGNGLITEMATPLVQVGPWLSLGWGPVAGVLYGGGFALGRSLPAWSGAVLGTRLAPQRIAGFFVENRFRLRSLGSLACVAGVVVALANLRGA